MVAVASPYASGTISSVSGTTTNISGGASAAWVGRCIRLTSGSGAGQIRKITAAPSATQITVDYAWDQAPATLAAEGLTDVTPASGTGFVISYFLDDIDDGTTLIKDANAPNEFRFINSNHTFSSTAFLYDTNKVVRVPTNNISLATTACWRLGDIDATGRTSNGCSLVESAAGSGLVTGWGVNGISGDLHLYGCLVAENATTNVFWRLYRNESHVVRFIDTVFNTPGVGMRIQGTKSAVLNCRWYGNTLNVGPFGPIGNFGLVKNVDVANGLNGVYHSWANSQSGQFVEGLTFSEITQLATIAGGGSVSVQHVWEAADVSINELNALSIFYAGGTVAGPQPLLRVSNYLTFGVVDQAGNAITESVRAVVRDNQPTVFANLTSTTGAFPRQKLLYREMPYLSGNVTWATAGGTTYAPYAIATASYLYQSFSGPLPMLTSQTASLTMLDDTAISETSKAVVDSYSVIADLNQLYDRAKSWFVDNLALAFPSFGVQPANANGSVLNFGSRNIVIDAAAAANFAINTGTNTATAKASTLAAGSNFVELKTTGTITFASGGAATARLSGILTYGTPGAVTQSLGTATLRFSTAGTYDLRGSNISGTVTLVNTSGGAVTVQLQPAVSFVNSGPSITVDNAVTASVSITGITAGSRLRIYNNTTATEVVNQIVSGTSYSALYVNGTDYTTGDTLTVTATWIGGSTAKLPYTGQAVVGSTGWALLVTQQDDAIYNSNGIDGTAITEFTFDYPNVQVDIDDPDGATTITRLYAWWANERTTEQGIRTLIGGLIAEDAANYKINTAVVDLKLDNTASTGVIFTGDLRLYRDDGAAPVVASTTGGGSITLYAGKVYTITTGGSALTPTESAKLMSLPSNALTTPNFLALK